MKRYLDDYAANSKNDGVGENWLDEAYDWGVFKDDCPVSIVFGKTQADRKAMDATGGWRDRKSTGEKTGSSYFFVKGCDPENGRELYPTAVDTPQQRVLAATTLSTGFTFDATAIAAPPTGGLPSVLLTRAAFEDAAVHHALLGTREPFRLTGDSPHAATMSP
ncbi:hypothetical protein OV207_13300 [Corallococcus sp. BB11-1]|uniref:hypothetical protein n=1 Tax=Corallococcus sp. BB11-1 TaxID=2996783 RepID=UPI00226E95B5|nr:hypothetical protein [Corallococcus sp. BB11-1]MCY1032442.1 hypothetical protein [Corallococcus sp. BB11-1]